MEKKEFFVKSRDGVDIGVLWFGTSVPNAPLLIDIHGGGFVGGHHYDDKNLCERFSKELNINVASIEYRYAPSVTYPKASEDCYDALVGLYTNKELDFDRKKMFLMGHSAGGNLAAGLAYLCGKDYPVMGLVLNYPFLDIAINPRKRKHIKYSIPAFIIKHFNDKYFPNIEQRSDFLASPVYISKKEAKFIPPTFISTCQYDSLRSDGIEFFNKLKGFGNEVKHIDYEGAFHGFIETVSNNSIDKNKWLSKKQKQGQRKLYERAFTDICKFITKEVNR